MICLKPRQERFCRRFAEYANAAVAAKAAGYAPQSARNAGYRLLRDPRILKRIAEIQVETADAHCRDMDVLLGKLENVYRRAIDDHHFSAAARAVELQAKLSGLVPKTAPRTASSTAKRPSKAAAEPGTENEDPIVEGPQVDQGSEATDRTP
jgi:crotonobetainyl-CoA:carnitine CoA-transferase CaiB-like acyl-CoA transferase